MALPHLQEVALPQAPSCSARDLAHPARRDQSVVDWGTGTVLVSPVKPSIKLPVSRAQRSAILNTEYEFTQGLRVKCLHQIEAGTRAALSAAMSKSSKRRKRTRVVVDRSATTDVVTQLVCAVKNPHAAAIGALVGGLVPWFGRTLAHDQVPAAWSSGNHGLALVMVAVVLGCACFSALSVYKFGRAAFGDARKALGFVLALEGVMLVSTGATSAVALVVLILINAMANGSVIALAREATRRRCEADARRATTRARNRASVPATRSPQPPIEVVESAAPAPRGAHVPRAPGLVKVPCWSPSADDTVIDAEIVSEELFS